MPGKSPRQVRKLRVLRWFGVLTLAALMTIFLVNVFVATPSYTYAQATETTATTEHATTTPEPEQAGSLTLPTPQFMMPTLPADAAGLLPADVNPANIMEECVGGKPVASGSDDGEGDQTLCPDQKEQLTALYEGKLPADVVAMLKTIAADKIEQYGPVVQAKLDDKASTKQDQRLIWIAIILIGVLPFD
jgi:hypothetical protein